MFKEYDRLAVAFWAIPCHWRMLKRLSYQLQFRRRLTYAEVIDLFWNSTDWQEAGLQGYESEMIRDLITDTIARARTQR